MRNVIILCLSLLLMVSCKNESPADVTVCDEDIINSSKSLNSILGSLPDDVVVGLAKNPTSEGALGRNREGYFHVRFQMDIAYLASLASNFESDEALQKFILATEYSFNYQKPAGDFELVIPPSLAYLGQPAGGDLSSGIAFFTSALGSSLILLQQSSWYANRPADQLTARLADLRNNFQSGINYLKTQKQVLQEYDNNAPNRLFFDALAFYSMGVYLNDDEAKAIGIEFIELALTKQDTTGYFLEGGGFDSSYNGVSLRLGLLLLGIVPSTHPLHTRLQKSMSCCAYWQASRVLSTGEISEEGNTRVFSGGESFLGEEKAIAWIDTLLSFYFVHSLSNQSSYLELANRIRSHYQ